MNELNPKLPKNLEEALAKYHAEPKPSMDFANRLELELRRKFRQTQPVKKTRERKTIMNTLRARPALALLIALLILLALSGVAYAIGISLGYIPGVGLIENTNGIRMLFAPVSVTRDEVTITVTNLFVFEDHIELIYEVQGGDSADVDPANPVYAEDNKTNPTAFCGGVEVGDPASKAGDSMLRLPDGTLLKRDHSGKYANNVFAMKPVYIGTIPPDVMEVTMLLDCIPWARLGAVPEDWEIPLKLKYVPAGTTIGEPVLDVTPTGSSSDTDNGITISLEKVVTQEDKFSFFFSIVPEKQMASLQTLYPESAYLIDSTGQKIFIGNWGPIVTTSPMGLLELQTPPGEYKPAYGPYTLVVDNILAYYKTNNSSFEFDPGENPQVGQTWVLDEIISFGGVEVNVVSAKMVEKDLSEWGEPWGVSRGFEFTFHSTDNQTPIKVEISDNGYIHDPDRIAAPTSDTWDPNVDFSTALYYLNGIPKDNIQVAIYQGVISIPGNWSMQWSAPDQTGLELLDASQIFSSPPGNSGITAELKRVVELEDGYLFYLHITLPEHGMNFQVIEPMEVTVADSTGRKIKLNRDGPQADFATDDSIWQFSSKEKFSDGSLQIVIEKAQVRYRLFSETPLPSENEIQQILDEYSFTFDVGENPEIGEIWMLDKQFEFGKYKGEVTSVQAVKVDSQQLPWFAFESDIEHGYEFTIQSHDPSIQWTVDMGLWELQTERDGFMDCLGFVRGKTASTTTFTITCRELPGHQLKATVSSISVLLDDVWVINWSK